MKLPKKDFCQRTQPGSKTSLVESATVGTSLKDRKIGFDVAEQSSKTDPNPRIETN